ncbi:MULTISPECIES: exodeoxyribonuclease VII small subunit [unclassified Enterococcus]|uniref:exodeoxyribonuclease VII small subunit n=1 Tax=unclassified Enterococcus TaxID=2608891 RepID=UPI0015577864|nr:MULTISPECIES: exodeoxyribonuclease VII small subunit [unclassified Enterococcus]MBS7575987.1 exodeoxyribonuclease VII small subunit [Enterococcus sp. MMGLQ5-2]MBS7583220.1 exodeoxyribonuclease VII small subunit [Enterococcus sp. MMGLQ5-1]NPD11080.1 exodeoxyribonuclease VII small subunit [Enterococcus sp. MMGLQ5-1]NPD35823.1 exodeoxyribonuclease VII small subunit [Enterococcus sp. MMGLQ5-2]
MAEEKTFEQSLEELEAIVNHLENGDVPLEAALAEYQKGMAISKKLQVTLKNAEKTLAKIVTDTGDIVDFEGISNE